MPFLPSSITTSSTTSEPLIITTTISYNKKSQTSTTVKKSSTRSLYPLNSRQYHYYDHYGKNGDSSSEGIIFMLNDTITVPSKTNDGIKDRVDVLFLNPFSSHNASLNQYVSEDSSTGFEDSSSSSSDSHEINKPFQVIIHNDKTIAHLIFDKMGRDIVHCELIDLEKEPPMARLPLVKAISKPLMVNYKIMLEAVRRCTNLALEEYKDIYKKPILLSQQSSTPSADGGGVMINQTVDSNIIVEPIVSTESSNILSMSGNFSSKNGQNGNATISISTTTTRPLINTFDLNINHFFTFWKGIMPGTKWCGLGDLANEYEDLGTKLDIDLCCRAHDHCPVRLKAFRTGYGIFNFSFYSKLHCDCDKDFYNCLKKSPNNYASMLGHFYFNVLKIHCLEDLTSTSTIVSANGSSGSIPSSQLVPQQTKICPKKRKISLDMGECFENGKIPDSVGQRMKIVAFGRHF